ncbi:YerC/YecD family TrpR-related protein [Dongshaea marina]|uniref:YerC/YecD family TrpR-related protein n=1 Tax=Dongshaea marina TaxID=2047966 RepID=UPI000D3E8BDB|nr:YerC/YecD family TrpR-related protein [Dongshaea marina]
MSNPDQLLEKLYATIASLDSAEEAKQFLNDLCTPQELSDMADRWRVVPLLKEGIAYREIAKQTGVSVTTIGRVARSLNHGEGGYELMFNRLEQHHRH